MKNEKYHSNEFNDLFKNYFFDNFCEKYNDDFMINQNQDHCSKFSQGIMQRGLEITLIKVYHIFRILKNDFLSTDRAWFVSQSIILC